MTRRQHTPPQPLFPPVKFLLLPRLWANKRNNLCKRHAGQTPLTRRKMSESIHACKDERAWMSCIIVHHVKLASRVCRLSNVCYRSCHFGFISIVMLRSNEKYLLLLAQIVTLISHDGLYEHFVDYHYYQCWYSSPFLSPFVMSFLFYFHLTFLFLLVDLLVIIHSFSSFFSSYSCFTFLSLSRTLYWFSIILLHHFNLKNKVK